MNKFTDHLASGLVRCPTCGAPMEMKTWAGRNADSSSGLTDREAEIARLKRNLDNARALYLFFCDLEEGVP